MKFKILMLGLAFAFYGCDTLLMPMPTNPTPTNPTKGDNNPPPPPKPIENQYSQHGIKPPTKQELASLQSVNMDGTECDVHGDAKRENDRAQNLLKNRFTFPKDSDFDPNFSIESVLDFDKNGDESTKFSNQKAGVLRGYVFHVKRGSEETCNCGAKNKRYQDVHIVITPNEKQTDKKYQVVVETTPRMLLFMEKRGVDWSYETLKGLEGYFVELRGWLFYDRIHEDEAFSNDPNDNIGRKNWRGTAWELHPVTDLRFVRN